MDTSQELINAARDVVKRDLALHKGRSRSRLIEIVRETLQDFFYSKTLSQPVILSNIIHV